MASGVVEIPLTGTPLGSDAPPSFSDVAPFALPRFVAGPENHLIEVAVDAVLKGPTSLYNPIVLYGPTGTGKTHLASGMIQVWKTRYPRRPANLICASDFAHEYREALETKTEDQFLAPYERARLLVIEDLTELAGRASAQQALIVLIDHLLASGSWVVGTSKTSPARVSGLRQALRARFTAGLTLQIALPSAETRLAVLHRVAALRGLHVADPVLEALAARLAVPVPELVGALVQLEGYSRLEGREVTLKDAHKLLADRRDARRPSLANIAKAAAKHFNVSVSDLRGPSRRRALVTARNVAIYLAKNLTEISMERIGSYFGNRDHTTVSYACRRVVEGLQADGPVRDAVADLQAKLLLR